jgi:hypothetical protein
MYEHTLHIVELKLFHRWPIPFKIPVFFLLPISFCRSLTLCTLISTVRSSHMTFAKSNGG